MMRRAKQSQKAEPFTYLHQGTTLRGDLKATGRVRVHGRICGNVEVVGVLEVAEGGVIEGEQVSADEVKIIGLVKADVQATGKVEIWRQGRLEGDVQAKALDIEEGAVFIGRSEMTAGIERSVDSASEDVLVEDTPVAGAPLKRASSEI